MTQHFIKKLAGFGWLKRAYYRFHEPRIVSAIYGAIYTLAMMVAGYNFFHRPAPLSKPQTTPGCYGSQ